MSFAKAAVVTFLLALCTVCAGDMRVQLNVNRPFNDVNEKFVSFAMKPEDLYKALDGPHRKSLTRMATMLGDSHVKFVGDFYFASSAEQKLRNPTKIIWKGFNRWASAVNWTMIIPVPYAPNAWDPMLTLKILNISHMIGISDCIWQLGNDFGSSNAQEYVTELNTFNLMVDSYKPYVDSWKVMGADISAGSSADETKRYIEMSKDINAAFGWTQPAELISPNSISSYIYDNDAALRTLLSQKVPVWLSLPQKSISKKSHSNRFPVDEATDALRWAQTLGDAASSGFDAIFKRISVTDLEKPDFSFYVTALFKKVMGSRVFPARPIRAYSHTNKLYTHCANAVSGGIAFMVVNTDESPLHISVTSTAKFTGTEVWQYTLTYQQNEVLLNNDKLTLNSTLKPQIKIKSTKKPVQLSTPGMSVSFWVLPAVNLEHCQYTEVEPHDVDKESGETAVERKYSSSDKLLKTLIQESSLVQSPLARSIIRKRRYATNEKRPKRFVLQDSVAKRAERRASRLEKLFQFDEGIIKKRENALQERGQVALQWFQKLLDNSRNFDSPLLKRLPRNTDDYFGPFFVTRDGKKTTGITKRITEIKKPEKKTKPFFNLDEFDEEEFFKKVDDQIEPEYTRVPQGDVHLKLITNVDGDEIEDDKEEKKSVTKLPKKFKSSAKEPVNEMKPLRLLPSEFYEASPTNFFKPRQNKMGFGGALNALLFPEPFSKSVMKTDTELSDEKLEEEHVTEGIMEAENNEKTRFVRGRQLVEDFLRAQRELRNAFLNDFNKKDYEDDLEDIVEKTKKVELPKSNVLDYVTEKPDKVEKLERSKTEKIESYFGELAETETNKLSARNNRTAKKELEEVPWWDLSTLRRKRTPRALRIQIPDEVWHSNMITKDDELMPLGDTMPEQLIVHENTVIDNTTTKVEGGGNKDNETEKLPNKLVATVKKRVSKFVDFLTRHVSEWYKTFKNHIDAEANNMPENNLHKLYKNW